MRTAEVQYHCATCDSKMKIVSISLGEEFHFVFELYCPKCKTTLNYAYTITYFLHEFYQLYAMQKVEEARPQLRLVSSKAFTVKDISDLHQMGIADEVKGA